MSKKMSTDDEGSDTESINTGTLKSSVVANPPLIFVKDETISPISSYEVKEDQALSS